MKNEYNGYFFNEFQRENGGNNYMDATQWEPFFQKVAKRIVDLFNPSMVLDAGCACGYLVAALRDLGVAAYGIDVSKYAIGKVREDVKEYCTVHSVLDPLPPCLPQTYDLVVASELLEHLFPEDGVKAIGKLCSYADTVLFSSTCQDVGDRTHVNVQLPEYWSEIFFTKSFTRNFIFDMSVLSPWCVVYEKFQDVKKVIFNYELNMRIDRLESDKHIDSTIEDIMSSLLQLESRIYFDNVSGFVEENAMVVTQLLEDSMFMVTVAIPEDTLSVRFDPIEGQYCLLKNVEIYLDHVMTTSFCTNGEFVNQYIVFNHLDPQIIVEGVQGKKEFKIVGKFQFLDDEFLQFYQEKSASIGEAVEQSKNQIALAQNSLQSIQEQLDKKDQLLTEKDGLLSEKDGLLSKKDGHLAEKDRLLQGKDDELFEKDNELAEIQGLLSDKDTLISQKDLALMDYAGKITQSDGELTQQQQTITELEERLAEKERLLGDLESKEEDSTIKSEELEALEVKASQVEELLSKVKILEKALTEKESALTRKNAELEKKEKALLETASTVGEKESAISEMDQELYQKNTKIVALQNEVEACEAVNETLTEQNKLINEHLDKVMASHEAMQNSSVWKLVAPFYKEPDLDEKGKGKNNKEVKDTKDSKDKKKKSGKDDKKSSKDVKGKKDEKNAKDKKGGKSEDKNAKGKKDVKGKKGEKEKPDGKKKAKKELSDDEEDIFLAPDESILDDLAEIRGTGTKASPESKNDFDDDDDDDNEEVIVAVSVEAEGVGDGVTVEVKSPDKKVVLERQKAEKKVQEKKPVEKKTVEKKTVEKKVTGEKQVKKPVKVEGGPKVTVKSGATVNVKKSPVKGGTVKAVSPETDED